MQVTAFRLWRLGALTLWLEEEPVPSCGLHPAADTLVRPPRVTAQCDGIGGAPWPGHQLVDAVSENKARAAPRATSAAGDCAPQPHSGGAGRPGCVCSEHDHRALDPAALLWLPSLRPLVDLLHVQSADMTGAVFRVNVKPLQLRGKLGHHGERLEVPRGNCSAHHQPS